MENILDRVSKDLILSELGSATFIKVTTNSSNVIYIVDGINHPNIMREIGILRELSFRNSGGGSGKSVDIDADDIAENGYKQLIVWDPREEEIVGGYRFIILDKSGNHHFSMLKYFDFDEEFMNNYYPYSIELGRSFIQPKYQSKSGNKSSLFTLDNLWEGLGAIIADNSNIKYMIGKVTMYRNINSELINMLYALLIKYFPVENRIICPKPSLEYHFDKSVYNHVFESLNYQEAMKAVVKRAKELDVNYPPLFAAYANLSHTMKIFGTVKNPDFGGVLETAMMITVEDMKKEKYDRYVTSYQNQK